MNLSSREDSEGLRLPEAHSECATAVEVKTLEKLGLRAEEVEAEIRAAFGSCTLGNGIGLWEADARDDDANPEELLLARARDEREEWQRIPAEDLCRCHVALNFTDALGYRFLLPAFMLADLDGGVDGMVLIHLSLTAEDGHGSRSKLNYHQVKSVIDFLELFLDDPDSDFHHESITQALAAFWKPLLRQRTEEAEQAAP